MVKIYNPDDGPKPMSRYDQLSIEPDNGKTLTELIVYSKPWTSLVEAGMQRVQKYEAESGFIVYVRGDRLIFGRLQLGTKQANQDERSLAQAGWSQGYLAHNDEFIQSQEVMKGQYVPCPIAYFHLHTYNAGFSEQDIDTLEEVVSISHHNQRIAKKADSGIEKLYDQNDLKIPVLYGLIAPSFISIGFDRVPAIKSISVLALSGMPSDNSYQALNFNRIGIKQQKDIFTKAGFSVFYKEFDVSKGKVTTT